MNAHEHHAPAAHHGHRSSADADGAAGKRPIVPEGPVASAAKAGSVETYKTRVGQFVHDVFDVKHDAIITFGPALTRSNGNPSSFFGSALKFAILAAGGPFVDALAIGVVAAAIVRTAIPAFAAAVGKSVAGAAPGPNSVATAAFTTAYAHAVKEHRSIVSKKLESEIHDKEDGKRITQSLGGELDSGRLQLTSAQVSSVTAQTQRETLDAWTVAMQKAGDKKDNNKQGFSDSSTGQLHLDSLLLRANDTVIATRARQARMEGVGNAAAQLDGARTLESIPVQRTMNVTWETPGNLTGQFGLSVSASGRIAEDELGHDDRAAVAMFYDHKSLMNPPAEDVKKDEKLIKDDFPKGLHKIWNLIKGKTPHQLGFAMKGD